MQSCALRLGAAHPQAGTCVLGGKLVLSFLDKPVLLLLSLPKNGVFFFLGMLESSWKQGSLSQDCRSYKIPGGAGEG